MDNGLLQQPFSRDSYLEIISTLFPKQFKEDVNNVVLPSALKVVESAKLLGTCELEDEPVAVFEVEHSASESARVNISTDVFKIMREHDSIRALVAFKSTKTEQWRLSLMTIDYMFDEKGKVTSDISNPRRYSFLLGPGAKVHTPVKQLNKQVKDFDDLLSRFSLEVVNKEFYNSIAVLFTELVGGRRSVNRKVADYPGLLKLPRALSSSSYQEFAVRLIGRIVFCWFLKEKKSEEGIPLMPDELLSLEASKKNKNYYVSILEKLFFETLNVEIGSRDNRYLEDSYKLVPYLNGGLFEPHDGDFYKDSKTIPDNWLTRLLEIFETYNFTIDENTISDVDLSIDPEMLGRIFENLLAEINPETGESARKSTGSFYTPREIVNYMVDESLVEILVEKTGIDRDKINALVTYDKLDDLDFPLTQDQKETVVNAVAELKILDPACGSGAFPIGILQKISMILQRADPDASMWFDKQTKSIPDPLLRAAVKDKFKNENLDWVRKLGIIKDVIYGVDIQPIAVEIAKLRCFLTLVVEEKIDDSQQNRGIQPLPNLDFKFVAANSLIPLEAGELNLLQDNDLQQKLADIRSKYFNARSLTSKTKLKEQYRSLNNKNSLDDDERNLQLRSFNPFTTNEIAKFFDSEIMFGIRSGFDIVIANPPYMDSETMKKVGLGDLRSQLTKRYLTAKGNWDIYIPFFELGLELLNKDGVLAYISPDKWVSKPFGTQLRERIILNISSVLIAGRKIFDTVNVDSIVTIAKGKPVPVLKVLEYKDRKVNLKVIEDKNNIGSPYSFDHLFSENLEEIQSIEKHCKRRMSDFGICENACATSDAYLLKDLLSSGLRYDPSIYLKVINTGTIGKYFSKWDEKEMVYLGDKYLQPVVLREEFIKKFKGSYGKKIGKPKVILKGLNLLDACLDHDGSVIPGKTTLIFEANDTESLKIVLAILNSDVALFYLKGKYPGASYNQGVTFTKDMINALPIPELNDNEKNEIIRFVDSILLSDVSNRDEHVERLNKYIGSLFSPK